MLLIWYTIPTPQNYHFLSTLFCLSSQLKWHSRGLALDQSLYSDASAALTDDYESVRMTATKLIWVLAQLFPEG